MEPTVTRPKSKTEFPLTESLAAPLLAAARQHFEQRLYERFVNPTSMRAAGVNIGGFRRKHSGASSIDQVAIAEVGWWAVQAG